MKKLDSRTLHDRWLTIEETEFELPCGRKQHYDIVRLGSGTGILAFLDEENVMLTRQYRPALEDTFLELIQGKCDEGETSLQAAHRELLEETGYKGNLEYLCHFKPLPSTLDADLDLYIATDLTKVQDQSLDVGEHLEVIQMPYKQLYNEIMAGRHTDAALQIAVYRAKLTCPFLTSSF